MTVTRQQRNLETNETSNGLTASSTRSDLLKTCQSLFAKDLSEEELQFWKQFLTQFSLQELRYAFDNWNRNGRWFPKPKDIGDQCEAYRIALTNSEYPIGCHRCEWTGFYMTTKEGYKEHVAVPCPCRKNVALREKKPYEHYGQGYGENDMKWLFRRMQQIYAAGDTPNSEALLTELDSKRKGGAPEWRREIG